MSRSNIMQDIPAQICWEYVHCGLDKNTAENVLTIASVAIQNITLAHILIYEIAYRTGYAHSLLSNHMSETSYKEKKQWIRNTIEKEIAGRSAYGT